MVVGDQLLEKLFLSSQWFIMQRKQEDMDISSNMWYILSCQGYPLICSIDLGS